MIEYCLKKIDWENEDKVWKEYAAKRIAREYRHGDAHEEAIR